MTPILLLSYLFVAPACSLLEASAPVANLPQGQAQAVEAVFVRQAADLYHDADPVQARSASFGRVVASVDDSPATDRLVEKLPLFVNAPVVAVTNAPLLSVDLVDSDPLNARGWR